jgi:hypothetical protein
VKTLQNGSQICNGLKSAEDQTTSALRIALQHDKRFVKKYIIKSTAISLGRNPAPKLLHAGVVGEEVVGMYMREARKYISPSKIQANPAD